MNHLMTQKEKEDAIFASNKDLIWPVNKIFLNYDFIFLNLIE